MNPEKAKKDRKMATYGSLGIHAVLLLIFLFFGLHYMEPKPEDGIPVNFGYQEAAGGSKYMEGPKADVRNESATASASSSDPVTQEVLTQNVVDAPSINEQTEEGADSEKDEQEPEKKPSNALENALNQALNSGGSSEGDRTGEGDMGDPQGDPDAPHGDGGGLGGDGNYRLGSRKALEKPLPQYDCNAEGRVVVLIHVNRNGEVERADPGRITPDGIKSTTTSNCLYERARVAAMKTRWQADPVAMEAQIGFIIYNFKKR